MAVFGKRVDIPGGHRRCVRRAVVLAASALGMRRSLSVIVPDLSETGAKLRARDLPEPGERLLINFGQTGLFATVAWSGGDECGILFDRRLDDRGVAQLETEAEWARVVGLGPASTNANLSPRTHRFRCAI